MSVLIVIPARYASTRYPAKPLALLTGASGSALKYVVFTSCCLVYR